MILSSCGCKVSWVLRGGCGSCGSLPGLRVLSTQQTQVCPASLLLQAILPATVLENPPDSPEPSISKSADFSMGTVVRYQSATLCRKCNKCRNFRPHAAGFTMIFTSAGLPTDWRSGSSSRMYPCPSSSSSVGKISSVFLKNFPRHI